MPPNALQPLLTFFLFAAFWLAVFTLLADLSWPCKYFSRRRPIRAEQ